MKNFNYALVLGVLMLGLSACGNKDNTTTANGANVGAGGYYDPVTHQWVSTGTTAGCIPLSTGTFPFTISGASVSSVQILGGNLGSSGNYGTSVVGTSSYTTGYGGYGGYGTGSLTKSSTYGTLQLSTSGSNMITGVLQLNQYSLQAIMSMSGGGYSYNQTSSCVSSVGVNAVYTNGYGYGYSYINQALVYLTVNGQVLGPIPLY